MMTPQIDRQLPERPILANWLETLVAHREDVQFLPNYARSIRTENLKGLIRRWCVARQENLFDPRLLDRWFPGQRGLLEMLAVMTEAEVARVAACNAPIFTLSLHDGVRPDTSLSLFHPNEFEAANRQEVFMALMTRRENVIESIDQATVQYDLSTFATKALAKYETHEMWDIAANPSTVMQPVATDQWVMVAAMRDLTVAQRTLYLGMSRRSKVSLH